MTRRPLVGAAALCLLPLAACAGSDDQVVTVLAAASLTETFTTLAEEFEAAHEGVDVEVGFGSSTTLAEQVAEGAPADVLATVGDEPMQVAAGSDRLTSPLHPFASNTMVLVTPADDPAGIGALADLDADGVDYVTCVETAPCGAAAAPLLAAGDVAREPASQEVDVKAALGRVTSGEADAAVVYRTDAVAAAGSVRVVEIPGAAERPTLYYLATVDGDEDGGGPADDFISFVLGEQGQAALRAAGFRGPAEP